MPETSDHPPPPPATEDAPTLNPRNPRLWIAAGAGLAAAMLVACVSVLWGLPLSKSMEPMESPTLVLVSADGKPFARRGAYKDEPVDVTQLPEHVPLAFVAIEDRRFFRHAGVDAKAIGRAFVANLRSGRTSQGGSTITQQLAKNAFTGGERTLRRKAREAVIALYLEARLSKAEILSRYLSSVYFGEGVFGLRGAAKHYFNKEPEKLTVGEAAMLAGMIKAPTRLSPRRHLKDAKERQQQVLAAMVETGVITQKQARAARNVKVREGRPALPVGSWFADWVSADAKDVFNRAYGEVRVQTTLDSQLQAQAEKILRRTLDTAGARMGATQGALVAMRTDGRVVAMVGGRDYKQSQFNRAVQAERQPGSSFKIFVYLAAIRQGARPDSLVLDAPVRIGNWSPENYEGKYSGHLIPLRQAFAKSSNVAAVRLAQQTGRGGIVQAARDLGLEGQLPEDATIALGTGSVTLLEMTAAYAAIAAGGGPIEPYGVMGAGTAAPLHRLSRYEQDAALQLLSATVTSGTGTGAALPIPTFGKTGTTQDYRDAWFLGFAGDLVVGVWMGNDDNRSMKNVTGGSLPASVWREFMTYAMSRGDIGPAPFAPQLPVTMAALEGEDFDDTPFMDDEAFASGLRDWFIGRTQADEPPEDAFVPPPQRFRTPPPQQPYYEEDDGFFPPPPPPRQQRRPPPEDFDEEIMPPPPVRRSQPPPASSEPVQPPPRIRREWVPPERPINVPDENGAVG